MTPLFSILHPSARPQRWREIYEDWMLSAAHPENVEYVLCVDERWGFLELPGFQMVLPSVINGVSIPCDFPSYWAPGTKLNLGERAPGRLIWNIGRRCYVDAVNTAAQASTGRILIVIADDQWPCERWDERIIDVLGESLTDFSDPQRTVWLDQSSYVISVSTGTPHEHERGIMVMPILSRARYERLGYIFFPEYESAFADNDFYSHAAKDNCIIDARHLMFPHRHPLTKPGAWEKRGNLKWIDTDAVYAAQNRAESYLIGEQTFRRRQAENFTPGQSSIERFPRSIERTDLWEGYPKISPQDNPGSLAAAVKDGYTRNRKPRAIALALPGEFFHYCFVAKLLDLTVTLMREGWAYSPLLLHCSEPGATRTTIVNAVKELKEQGNLDLEFILWIDDDQIVEPQQVLMLINDLEQLPEVDVMAGWTWLASSGPNFNQPQASCGRMNIDKGEVAHANYETIQAVQSADGVFEVGWTGFPVVLMRTSALDKVGKHPFTHYPCPESAWGECGEDISFCKRLTDAGGKIYVDSRVFVPHLKMKALGPIPPSKEEIALALTGNAEPKMPPVEGPKEMPKGMASFSIATHLSAEEKERRRIAEEERQRNLKLVVGDEMLELNAEAARFVASVFEDLV
jgi:hypothetical protein